jgi:hypothetical protein
MRSSAALVLVAGMGLVGCAAGTAGEGTEEAGQALVMLDGEARAAGFSLLTDEGKIAPLTPIPLEGAVTLVGPGQRIPLAGVPGEVLVVTGKRGALVGRTLTTEVDSDSVRVDGDEPSVRRLATALGAKVVGQGPWQLHARGVLTSLSREGSLAGIRSIELVDTPDQAVQAAVLAADDSQPFSAADPRFKSFGVLGGHAPVCPDPAAGTWVSIPQHFAGWHVFTLHVEAGASSSELTGTVDAHVWSGGAAEEPPASCDGTALDVHVSMPATGTRDADGSFRFDAGGWHVDRNSCTADVSGFSYLPDHFSGAVAGGALRSLNHDGSAFDNAPIAFERVSCE